MPGALEPELNELPDSGENEIEGPGNIGAFEKSVTSLFHRKPRVPDSTRWRKNQSTIPLQSELGNTKNGGCFTTGVEGRIALCEHRAKTS